MGFAFGSVGALVVVCACATAIGCSDSNGPARATPGDGGTDAEATDAMTGDAPSDAPSDSAKVADTGADGSLVVRKVVFVSAAKSDGTMTFGGLFVASGRASADKLCNQEANRAGLGGTFIAYLSTFNESAPDRLPDNAAWYLVSTPVLIFSSRMAIPGGPQNPLDREANGSYAGGASAWTGTDQSGVRAANLCNDWLEGTTNAAGRRGRVGAVGLWVAENDETCEKQYRVYCFQK